MKTIQRIKQKIEPSAITFTENEVILASNISQYTDILDENTSISGYIYDAAVYTKDEYIQKITLDNAATISQLQDELEATKIILGVE